jgi:hypothetical protein
MNDGAKRFMYRITFDQGFSTDTHCAAAMVDLHARSLAAQYTAFYDLKSPLQVMEIKLLS